MVKNAADKHLLSTLWVVVITAALTLLLVGGAHYLGFLKFPGNQQDIHNTVSKNGEDRKIAYWRAPMNPTEIYDKPGKSAMGMDLDPVYEDELTENNTSGSDSQRKIAYWRAPMNPAEI